MRISGFTMAKNADKLYYPIKQAIMSILPIVDEFVVVLGDSDADDRTEALVKSITSDKIRIIHTQWDTNVYPNGTENAHQTDIAIRNCSGDWLFYLQADEVIHEKYLPVIAEYAEKFLEHPEVEGFIFDYIHFWGDYSHHQVAHGWYKKEIRIIRRDPDIHSWESAQSFRRIPGFDGKNYRIQEGTYKLKVIQIPAKVYHYGWVRPPRLMRKKQKSLDTIHKGASTVATMYQDKKAEYDYGPLSQASLFKETHPEVMKDWIAAFDWGDQLNYTNRELNPGREKNKHDRFKNKLLTFIEQRLLGGRELFAFKNYILLRKGK